MYRHAHAKDMPLRAIARLIQTMLYAQRFFPYYVYNILGGIEEDGECRSTTRTLQCVFISFIYQAQAQSTRSTRLAPTNVKTAVQQVLLSRSCNHSWTIRYLLISSQAHDYANRSSPDLLQESAANSWRTSSSCPSSALESNRSCHGQLYECDRETHRGQCTFFIPKYFFFFICGRFRMHFIPIFNQDCTRRTRVAHPSLFSCVLGSLLLFTSISMTILNPALTCARASTLIDPTTFLPNFPRGSTVTFPPFNPLLQRSALRAIFMGVIMSPSFLSSSCLLHIISISSYRFQTTIFFRNFYISPLFLMVRCAVEFTNRSLTEFFPISFDVPLPSAAVRPKRHRSPSLTN